MHIPNEMAPELAGVHGLNAFFSNNSAARSVMFANHFSQRLVIHGATEKIVQTGFEHEFAKYTLSIKMPEDGVILRVIERYPPGVSVNSINFNPETLVIYENAHTKEVEAFSIPYHQSYHQYFGFKNNYVQENLDKLVPGVYIEKDTKFADSPAVTRDGGFKFGVSLNIALMSHPSVSEDGIAISKSALEKMSFTIYETRVIEFGSNNFPLNIYGNLENYKCFPDIGDYVREDGIVMALRKADDVLAPMEMSIYSTTQIDQLFDTCYYARGPGGRIVDIKIYKDERQTNPLPEQMVKNINKYVNGLKAFHEEIARYENELRERRKSKFNADNLSLSPYLHRLVVESYAVLGRLIKGTRHSLNLCYKKTPMSEYRATFTIEYNMTPGIGNKITDLSGGVIANLDSNI